MAINWEKTAIVVDEKEIIILADDDTVNASCGKSIIFTVQRESSGSGEAVWGEITGVLSAQLDLKNALDAKADTADLGDLAYKDTADYTTDITNKPTLGTMSTVNDAPSDGKEYARKNGAWSEVEGGGGGSVSWGSILGTLSNQTDLQTALDGKTNLNNIASEFDPTYSYPSGINYVTYEGQFYAFVGPYQGAWSGVSPTAISVGVLVSGQQDMYILNRNLCSIERTNVATQAYSAGDLIYIRTNNPLSLSVNLVRATTSITSGTTLSSSNIELVTIESLLAEKLTDAPSDGVTYGRKNGAWSPVPGGGGGGDAIWGLIEGTLSNQTDLQNALNAKANTSALGDLAYKNSVDYSTNEIVNKPTLGTMARVNDAESNNLTYGRKNGHWEQILNNSVAWGSITGTLSNQTDLQNAIEQKLTMSEIVSEFSATKNYTQTFNYVSYEGKVYLLLGPYRGSWAGAEKLHSDTEKIGAVVAMILSTYLSRREVTAEFSNSLSYAVGDYVFYNTYLYRFTSAHSGDWDDEDAVRVTVMEEILSAASEAAWGSISGTLSNQTDLQNALDAKANTMNVTSNIETSMSATQAYSIGDLIFVAGTLYRATASISSGASLVVGTNVAVATVEDLLALKADSSALSSYAPLASPALTGSPTAPTQTAGDNSTKIATTAYVDSGLSGKSDTGHTHDDRYYTESEIDGKFGKEIQYYSGQTVSVASSAQIMRIPASGTSEAITTDTVVLNCTFANPANISSNVTWTSYAGYITFSGTCTTATTANVTLGQKGN